MTLTGVMTVTLRYFNEFGKRAARNDAFQFKTVNLVKLQLLMILLTHLHMRKILYASNFD